MAPTLFGVTYSKVRAHHFPQLSEFSTSSKPTAATVTEMVADAAAVLAGKLRAEGIAPSGIVEATSPEAYAWCARAVRLGAAIAVLPAITGMDPAVLKRWQATLDAMWGDLDEGGAVALGDAPTPSSDANGPRTFVSSLGLDTGDSADDSDLMPHFRRNDRL